MTRHTIVCVTTEGTAPHRHVATVAVDTASRRWSVDQVRASIEEGSRYAMRSRALRAYVDVSLFNCECGASTIRSFTMSPSDPDVDELEEFATCPPLELTDAP